VTRFLTCHTNNTLVTRITHVVPSLPKDHHDRAFRQVAWNPWRSAFHQTTSVPWARRGGVWASWRASALHHVPQLGQGHVVFARVDVDDSTLMPCRPMRGLLPRAAATCRIALSGPGAWAWPLPRQDVVDAEGWWSWARRAGWPAPPKHGGLCMARGIRAPAMDAVVVRRLAP
jgi:hypothetical protein